MLINISEIISTTDKSESYSVNLERKSISIEGLTYAFAEISPISLTVTNIGEKELLIEGHCKLVLNVPCDRCLKNVPVTLDLPIEKTVDLKESDTEGIENLNEANYIEVSSLDVDKLVCNEILVNFPMKTLCREDCKGLCQHCGKDLNIGGCDCNKESLDPRMSAIRDIFKNFKEV